MSGRGPCTTLDLVADCERCCGLCCTAPVFSASPDFAIDKPAGQPCPHLRTDFRCEIHAHLEERGFGGCVAFDCHGAGQKVTQRTFGGRDWQESPEIAPQMFGAFMIMRKLHEHLMYLDQALELTAARPLHAEIHGMLAAIEELTLGEAAEILEIDAQRIGREVHELLLRVGALVRAEPSAPPS